ncbi:outer membrane beta-barrel protein [Flavihumibacter profundi]|uniref:outer membrane beta-barrel protein n=1 Tax=Flavihumibacter profundi TaxID=2716883 RepID=UPI001CC7B94D|nr:outer membrane beta-barrel protein [Flavihumibacter profundi]MBZ5856852.1 PorT family protein [Flavihumibacter profundi]
MFKRGLIVFILISVYGLSFSQSNFIDAIIINRAGDSVPGKVDYRNWKNNPENIVFLNLSGDKKVFTGADIKGFYIPSVKESYAGYNVGIDMLPGDKDLAISNVSIDSPTIHRPVFLLQLLRHPSLTLYQFRTRQKDHYYYVKDNQQPVELIHNYSYEEANNRVLEHSHYIHQLDSLFSSCTAVQQEAGTVKYTSKSITNIFLKYLECTVPGSSVEVKKKDPTTIKFGIIGGVSINSFDFTGSSELAADNYSGNVSPIFGLSMDIGLPRNRNKWHLVNELGYKAYATENSLTNTTVNGYGVNTDVKMSFSYVQLNTLARYIFYGNKKMDFYFNAGIGNAFMIAENENSLHAVYSYGTEVDGKAIEGPRRYEFSVLGGAGLSVGKIQFEFRYAFNKKGFSPSFALDVNPRSYQFLLTYQF